MECNRKDVTREAGEVVSMKDIG